ncbi:MAG: hypothetical protein OEZ58_11955 [Gammaproteobacteria bacterium]|nr:hypothetical protein [Gammaproteobacteria bacterium]MDH5729697.1 hypothetical protein [Gammaproteobacteria bacterium]
MKIVFSKIFFVSISLLFSSHVFAASWNDQQTIYPNNNGPWGDWFTYTCPTGKYVNSFVMTVESNQGRGDDTAANRLALRCTYPGTSSSVVLNAFPNDSNYAPWGSWGSWRLCDAGGEAYLGLQIKVEPNQKSGDDTALNASRFLCAHTSSGGLYEDNPFAYWQDMSNPGPWGSWSNYVGFTNKSSGYRLCGVRVRIEKRQGRGDDTAGNSIAGIFCGI